jgi:hypothetical protein
MRRSAGDWAGRIAAFVFSGAAVAFGASILASWMGLNGAGIAVVVVVVLAVLGHRILSLPDDPAKSPNEEKA